MSTALLHHFLEPRVTPKVASEFYQHPYGGIARDIWVTREGFARFFDVTLRHVDNMHVNCKWFDVMEPRTEYLGYKIVLTKDTLPRYRITIIERGHRRVQQLVQIAPYLWEVKGDSRETLSHSQN